MKHKIYISGGSPAEKKLIRRCINAALEQEGVCVSCEISVLLTDDAEVRRLNAEFRNIDRETDVLSFPALELCPGELPDESCADQETGLVPLGDMALSLERAAAQAAEFGHTPEREAGYLSVHSALHLLGYDHENDEEKAVMREKEERVMESLGLNR